MDEQIKRIDDLQAAGKIDAADAARLKAALAPESSAATPLIEPELPSTPAAPGVWGWLVTCYWGVLFFITLVIYSTSEENIVLIKQLVFTSGAYLGGLLSLLPALLSRRTVFPRPLLLAAFVLAAALLPSVLFSNAQFMTFPHLILHGAYLVMALSLGVIIRSFRQVWLLAGFIYAAGFTAIGFGLLQYARVITWGMGNAEKMPMISTFGSPPFYAGFLILFLPLPAVILTWTAISICKNKISWRAIGAAIASVILFGAGAFSLFLLNAPYAPVVMGVALLMTVGLALYELLPVPTFLRRSGIQLLAAGAVAVGLGIILFAGYQFYSTRPVDFSSPAGVTLAPELLTRWVFWQGGLSMWQEKPLAGYGFGTFQINFPTHRHPSYNLYGVSHNTKHAFSAPVQLLATTGLSGYAGALFFFGVLLISVLAYYQGTRSDQQVLFLAFAGSLAGGLLLALFTADLEWTGFAVFFWLIIGLLWGMIGIRRRECHGHALATDRSGKLRYVPAILAGAGLIMLTGYSIVDLPRQMEVNYLLARGDRFIEKNPEEAIAIFNQALAIDPDNLSVRYKLAYLHLNAGNQSAALLDYGEIIRRAPDYAQVHHNLALMHHLLGQFDDARREIELVAKRQRDVTAYAAAASIYYYQGNVLRALQLRDEALAIIKEERAIINWKADIEYNQKLGTRWGVERRVDNAALQRLKEMEESLKQDPSVWFAGWKNQPQTRAPVPFPVTDPGSPLLAETVRRLKIIDAQLEAYSHGPGADLTDPARHNWLTSDEEFARWREKERADLGDTVFSSPWGVPVEYIFTARHHSYMLNAYDTAGVLAVSWLGGASNRVGPVIYQAPDNMRTPVGMATANFIWNRDAFASPVGNLVTDAMRENAGTDFALLNFLAMRGNIPQGTVTREHLELALPFGNRIAVVLMTGRQVADEIAKSVASGIPFAVSGLQTTAQNCVLADGSLLEVEKTYTVALPDYIVEGGRFGDYASFAAYSRKPARDVLLVDVVAEYIRRHSPISPHADARLIPKK